MNEIFEKIYNDNNTDLNESSALFEKVYTEAEMLNEMNPKLRALLAAGLIGTAGLGATSCSMPTDDPTGYEQPAPETTNPDDPGDNNEGDELTEEQRWAQTPFGQLGVTREDAEIIASEDTIRQGPLSIGKNHLNAAYEAADHLYVYINGRFVSYQENVAYDKASYLYKNTTASSIYVIPADMEEAFDNAIAAL